MPAKKKCKNHFCIHWVTSTADAPPSQAWVDTTLTYMNKVWRNEVQRPGLPQARSATVSRGGNAKFDVYLKELGSPRASTATAPRSAGRQKHKWLASGYCVLDNDFAGASTARRPRRACG